MPAELLSVTETAKDFLTRTGHLFAQLQQADFDAVKKQWMLIFNVGITRTDLKKIVVDDASGKVVGIESVGLRQ